MKTEAAVVPVQRASAIAARADEQDVGVAVGVDVPDGCAGEERGPQRVDVREPAIEVGRRVLVGKAGGLGRHFREVSASVGPNVREGRSGGQRGEQRADLPLTHHDQLGAFERHLSHDLPEADGAALQRGDRASLRDHAGRRRADRCRVADRRNRIHLG